MHPQRSVRNRIAHPLIINFGRGTNDDDARTLDHDVRCFPGRSGPE